MSAWRAEEGRTGALDGGLPSEYRRPSSITGKIRGGGVELVGRAFRKIDAVLRRHMRICEFSSDPYCIIRLQLVRTTSDVLLGDGSYIERGSIVGELHLWNEQLPRIPLSGPGIAWSLAMRRRVEYSLGLLASELSRRPDLDELKGLRARMTFAGGLGRATQVSRVAMYYGFELVARADPSVKCRDLIELAFAVGLVCAFNPAGLRCVGRFRQRYDLWMSRRKLAERYTDWDGVAATRR